MPGKKKMKIKKKKQAAKKPRKFLLVKKSKNKKILNPVKLRKVKAKSKKAAGIKKNTRSKLRPQTILSKRKPFTGSKKSAKLKEEFVAESFFKAKIKVLGIGGGGGSIISEISRSLNKATFIVADTDSRAFKKKKGIKYFNFGQKLTHGLGTGLNTDLAKMAAEQESQKISEIFKDQNIVIMIASLGGGVGSGAGPVFAKASENFEGITFGIFTLPFKFEGVSKHKTAKTALSEMRKHLNVSMVIPNEAIFKVIDENTPITDAFSVINKNLIESLESIIDLIYNPGVINIDFADLRTILSGKGNLAFLNVAEASGKSGSEKIVKEILHNPLYQSNNFTADRILFNIQGGNGLSMFEVGKISRAISEKNPKAKIIFGISKNLKYKNKIKTTILMTGPPFISEKPQKEPVKKEVKTEVVKKVKKVKKEIRKSAAKADKKTPFNLPLAPVFEKSETIDDLAGLKITGQDLPQKIAEKAVAIRRTALEIKEAQTAEENKKSQQEKEWEIPAFLRKVKFK